MANLGLSKIDAASSLLLSAAVVLFFGYHFPYGDQTAYLLEGLKWFDPNFCKGDWHTHDNIHFHLAFAIIIYALKSINLLPLGMLILHLVTLWLTILGIFHLAASLKISRVSAILAIGTILLAYNRSIGSTVLFYNSLVPRTIASMAMPWIVSFALRRDYLGSSIALAITMIFHLNIGVNMALVCFVFLALTLRNHWQQWKQPLLYAAIIVLPAFVVFDLPFVLKSLQSTADPETSFNMTKLLMLWRGPHHHDPLAWANQWPMFLTPLAMTMLLPEMRSRLTHFTPIICVLFLICGVFSILFLPNFLIPVRLYPWGLAPLITVIAFLTLFHFLASYQQSPKHWPLFFLLMQLLFLTAPLMFGGLYAGLLMTLVIAILGFKVERLLLPTTIVAAIVAITLVLLVSPPIKIAWIYPLGLTAAYVLGAKFRLQSPVLAGTSIILLLSILSMTGFSSQTLKTKFNYVAPDTDYHQTLTWIRENTPPGSIFAVFPSAALFRVSAERGVIATYKTPPLVDPGAVAEWKNRLEDLIGVDDLEKHFPADFQSRLLMDKVYFRKSASHFLELQQKYKLSHILTTFTHYDLESFYKQGFYIAYAGESYLVLKFPESEYKSESNDNE